MNRQAKAFLLSLIIHAFAIASMVSINDSIAGLNAHRVIDLSMLDTGGASEAVPKKMDITEKRVIPSPVKPRRDQQKVFKEMRIEKTQPLPQPQFTEVDGPAPILTKEKEGDRYPATQPSKENINPASSAGQVIASITGTGGGAGKSVEQLRQRYISEHFSYIRQLIQQNLTYPSIARKFKWAGRVNVSFMVRENGRADNIRILESSGYDILDKNVIETIKAVSPFPKPPVMAELHIPIIYHLE